MARLSEIPKDLTKNLITCSVIEWITKWSEFLSFNSTRTTDYNILNGEGDVKSKEMSLIVFVQYFGEVKKIRNSKP